MLQSSYVIGKICLHSWSKSNRPWQMWPTLTNTWPTLTNTWLLLLTRDT